MGLFGCRGSFVDAPGRVRGSGKARLGRLEWKNEFGSTAVRLGRWPGCTGVRRRGKVGVGAKVAVFLVRLGWGPARPFQHGYGPHNPPPFIFLSFTTNGH